jgi:chromosome segregation ATPase
MSDAWFNENRVQLLSSLDTLLAEARSNATELDAGHQIQTLVQQAEQQYAATEAALRSLSEQRQALLQTLQQLQTELAVAGRPVTGEIS